MDAPAGSSGAGAPRAGARAPEFSLVVPTLGRQDEVYGLLESIERHGGGRVEVIIVDQNRDDRLGGIAQRFGASFPLRHCRVDFRGAARARNYGARFAAGRYLNLLDDDCELVEDTLAVAAELFARTGAKVVIGRTVGRDGTSSHLRFARDETVVTAGNMWGRNVEATMFFAREVFARAGGYDEAFGVGSVYGADEGAELLMRLFEMLPRGAVFYSPRVRLYHPDKGFENSVDKAFNYARGRGALIAKFGAALVPHAAVVLVKTLAAIVLFRGERNALYRSFLAGLMSGYRDYRSARRKAPALADGN